MNAIDLDNYKIAYTDVGTGTPVVLLHGYPLDHTMWQAQIDGLADACRVIAPDLRGFGESTIPAEDAQEGVAMSDYAHDVAQLLDALAVSDPVILCGFSMGGYILWQFVRLFANRVRAIVACDTRAIADSDEARQGRLQTAESVFITCVQLVVAGMLPKLLSPATLTGRPKIISQVEEIMSRSTPEAIAAALRGMAVRDDVTAEIPSLDVPALVIVGAEDGISTPDEMREIAEQLPQADLVIVPNAGHMTPCENPSAVTHAIRDFIRKLS